MKKVNSLSFSFTVNGSEMRKIRSLTDMAIDDAPLELKERALFACERTTPRYTGGLPACKEMI